MSRSQQGACADPRSSKSPDSRPPRSNGTQAGSDEPTSAAASVCVPDGGAVTRQWHWKSIWCYFRWVVSMRPVVTIWHHQISPDWSVFVNTIKPLVYSEFFSQGRGLWAILQPTTRGPSRCSGFTLGGCDWRRCVHTVSVFKHLREKQCYNKYVGKFSKSKSHLHKRIQRQKF